MFQRFPRRRSRRGMWPILSRFFYINPRQQYLLIMVSAIAMATLVFSGLLLFRQADRADLMMRGKWYMKQGKVALAAKTYEQLVHNDHGSYDGHLELGKAYMQLEEPELAAKEFRIASRLRSGDLHDSAPHIAISRMMIAEGKYEDAQKQLFQAYNARKQNRNDPELLLALVDLYDDWGNSYLAQDPPDYKRAFDSFLMGLRFVKSESQQAALQEKFVKTARQLADTYDNNNQFDDAINVLSKMVPYDPSSDNLLALSAMYERKDDLDNAIYWCRKAYQNDPKSVSLKLSNMLIQKGKELNEAHQPEKAADLFTEAKQVDETVKLPLDDLYPVEASDVKLAYNVNSDAETVSPKLTFTLMNAGTYPVNYLEVKASFVSGDKTVADADQVIVRSDSPLAPQGKSGDSVPVKIEPGNSILLSHLVKKNLKVRVTVRYSDSENSKWYPLKNSQAESATATPTDDTETNFKIKPKHKAKIKPKPKLPAEAKAPE